MKSMRHISLMVVLAGAMVMPVAAMADAPTYPYPMHGPGMMMGYNPWAQLTPEQRQQMWQYMQQQGYGPGMMGYGGGPQLTPEQRQQMWQYMQSRGYGPGMMMGPGMMGPANWQPMTPEQYKKWWDETHPVKPQGR